MQATEEQIRCVFDDNLKEQFHLFLHEKYVVGAPNGELTKSIFQLSPHDCLSIVILIEFFLVGIWRTEFYQNVALLTIAS